MASGYRYQLVHIKHSDCGGVSDGEWCFHVYQPEAQDPIDVTARMAGRDMYSIINSKAEGLPCKPPVSCSCDVPKVVKLRPGTYHVGGLYPTGVDKVHVIVPSVFSPTKWVRRRLTGLEMCKLWDIPEEVIVELGSKDMAAICEERELLTLKVAHCLL